VVKGSWEYSFHRTDDQLEQYALNRLPEADLAGLEEHLLVCAGCRERLDEIGDFALGMTEAPTRKSERWGRGRWWAMLKRPAFVMSVAFAVLILAIAVFSNFSKPRQDFAPLVSLQLTALRGEMPSTVPAIQFNLMLTDGPREGGPFRIEVVDAAGTRQWTGLAASSPAGVLVKVSKRLTNGDYFVRLYTASGQMLREYGFRVRA
jgi:hypothetical protein